MLDNDKGLTPAAEVADSCEGLYPRESEAFCKASTGLPAKEIEQIELRRHVERGAPDPMQIWTDIRSERRAKDRYPELGY